MAHVRQQIRDASAVALIAGIPAVGGRVFKTRRLALQENDYPCIEVFCSEEQSERDSMNNGGLLRQLRLGVVATIQQAEPLDNALDDYAAAIEATLHAAADGGTLDALVKDLFISSTALAVATAGDGNHPIGEVALEFTVIYRTLPGAAETAL